MSIADWFKAREDRKYTTTTSKKADVPEGVWTKCPSCKRIIYEGELAENLRVCKYCTHHFELSAHQRIEQLAEAGSFEELDAALVSGDPLSFDAVKPYAQSMDTAREKTGLAEAIVVGRARVGGHDVVLGAMDFRFIAASMGSVVGEKIARAFETALAERRPVVFVVASGGARMQEGMLSLMQMAKTSAAVARHADAGLPYISVLTHPTMGGVTASFAVLSDVILAEPGALIGFAGERVIEQTIRQKLPKGFRSAEFMRDHGMVDDVVSREELADRVGLVLDYLTPRQGGEVA